MKRFGEFAKDENILDGEKMKLAEILNREITVVGYKIRGSQYAKSNAERYLSLQFELDGTKHVTFTGSNVLIDQVEKYKDEIPFLTTIIKIDKYFTFS